MSSAPRHAGLECRSRGGQAHCPRLLQCQAPRAPRSTQRTARQLGAISGAAAQHRRDLCDHLLAAADVAEVVAAGSVVALFRPVDRQRHSRSEPLATVSARRAEPVRPHALYPDADGSARDPLRPRRASQAPSEEDQVGRMRRIAEQSPLLGFRLLRNIWGRRKAPSPA